VARKHHRLLVGPLVGEERLRPIQRAYQEAASEPERRAIALEFEQAQRDRDIIAAPAGRSSDCDPLPLAAGDFFAECLRHQKGPAAGQPFLLEPWQREFVDELYRLDERGNRIYKRAILGVPRGNGKSPIAAAVGLYELMTRTDEPDVICAAAARHQAGVVFE